MNKIQLYSYGEIQANQMYLLEYTKTCPKLAVFGHFLIFSVLGVHFLKTWNLKSASLFIKCWMKYPKWPIYAISLHKMELSNFTKNEIVLSPMHGGWSADVQFTLSFFITNFFVAVFSKKKSPEPASQSFVYEWV